jgi:hypothetical protein
MRWLRTLLVINRGGVEHTAGWRAIHESYVRSIASIDFPDASGRLKLRRKFKRPDGQWDRNGVGYLRRRFLDHLTRVEGWRREVAFDLGAHRVVPMLTSYPALTAYQEPIASDFGGFDFVTTASDGTHVAIEWETGNVSSSHRSVNKLAIALISGSVHVGVLIVPSRPLYEHLTDRIGNIDELSGYLSMWKDLEARIERGLLAISVVEHDDLTDDPTYPYLPAGTDGRARQGKAKRR